MQDKHKLVIVGVATGTVCLLVAWGTTLFGYGLEWSLGNIVQIHHDTNSLYIVDLAPLILGMALHFSTIVRRKQAIHEIGRKAELFLDAAAEGFYGIDIDGRCTFVNEACVRLLGYQSKSGLLGQHMHDLVHHSHADESHYPNEKCKIYKAFRNGLDVFVDDEVFWRADGTCFPVQYNANPILDENAVVGAIVGFSDISERRRHEELEIEAKAEALKFKTAMNDISESATLLSVLTGIEPFYVSVARIVAKSLGVERVAIWRFEDHKQALVAACRFRSSTGLSKSGQTIKRDEIPELFEIISGNAVVASSLPHDTGAELLDNPYLVFRKMKATIVAPVLIQGDSIGALTVACSSDGRVWRRAEEDFLRSAAMVLAVAMETSQRINTEHREKQIFKTMIDGLITIDEKGVIQSFNPASEKLFGYTAMEVIGKNLNLLMGEPHRTSHSDYLKSYVRGGPAKIIGTPGIEVDALHKSGQSIPIAISISEMLISGERVFSGVIRDRTDQRRLQLERQSALEDLQQLVDNANAPIFAVNNKLQITEWNQYITKMTGYEKDEVASCLFVAEMIEEKLRADVTKVLNAALAGHDITNYEAGFVTRSGNVRTVLLSASARRDITGKTIGVIGVGQDITELREKEQALSQAQKMEAVGQLTGGIAHDFNNLLSVIKGNLRFLQDDIGVSTPDIKDLFDDAISAVDDGADLTRRLLTFSRRSALNSEPMDVCHAIDEYVRFLTRTIGGQHELIAILPDEPLYINADRPQFDNSVLNLVLNAKDALPDGGPISISVDTLIVDDPAAEELPRAGVYVRVTVQDRGIGISPKNLSRVFEPFFTTKGIESGTGLGLSMIYGFTKQSGGTCNVTSELGTGSSISMLFPETADRPSERASKDESVRKDKIADATILVVEDDARLRRTVLRDLRKLGYRTIEAESGDMAKDIVDSGESIDLVFSDILMPGKMNGRMLAQWITENHAGLKVVLTSGFSDSKTGVPEKDKFPLVRKPYSLGQLAQTLQSSLES